VPIRVEFYVKFPKSYLPLSIKEMAEPDSKQAVKGMDEYHGSTA
jgi:hypothetical protein